MKRIRFYGFVLALLLVVSIAVPLLIGAVPMWMLVHPACSGEPRPSLTSIPNAQYIDVRASEGGTWRTILIPGSGERGRAMIIAPAAFNGNVLGPFSEVGPLAQAGYSVVMIESVVCARGGVHSLGYKEAAQTRDVIDYFTSPASSYLFDHNRIALHGFSSAGATSIFTAADDSRIAAVLAEGNYADMNSYLSSSGGSVMENLLVIGARLSYRIATGESPEVLAPLEAIRRVPPRPIFLIYGERELPRGNYARFSDALAGSPNVELWIVPGAEHGEYIAREGANYHERLLRFYDCALLDECPG